MNDHCKTLARTPRCTSPDRALLKPRWKFSALAAALLACAGMYAADASALALGPITVQSALGEPLRAEIDLPQITPAEAESLRASTASAEIFRAQGMEYSSTASQTRVQLHRRPDGRTVLRLSGNSPVNEPFVDLVIDARWSAGHVTRSYTMLFDPPSAQRPPPITAVAPALAVPESRSVAAAAPARRAVPTPSAAASDASSAAPARPVRTEAPARNRPPEDGTGTTQPTVQVRPGDTAGSIANARRPQGVSLDQMLVAMTRANPDAFMEGNVNRLKAGSVLQIPDREEALATQTGQARQLIAVQSRDFNDFRRRLAGAAPDAEQVQPQRTASGSVQTRTEDRSAPAPTPDKLTLSKGAMQGQKATEEMLVQRKQASDTAARTQELAKNIEELNRLNAASGVAAMQPAVTTAAAALPAAPGLAVTNPGLALPTEPSAAVAPGAGVENPSPTDGTPAAPTDAAAQAETDAATPADPNAAASAPAVTPPLATPVPPEPVPESASFVQGLLDQPVLPLAGGALLLLLGYGAYRGMQHRRSLAMVDSGFVDSRVHPDSFFGTSGGQRVDTTSSNSTLGAMSQIYSHSQLDTGGEVDPVAEADVYLAYGRDLQAEEILREASRHNPTRVPIFVKLGEIYAKRLDRKALEAVASDVHRLTQGKGAEWEQMVELGRTLDPDNALYQPGGIPSASVAGMAGLAAAGMAGSRPRAPLDSMSTVPQSRPMDLDLSLDFDLPDDALTEVPGEGRPSIYPPPEGPEIAHAQAQDWDALEDLVAFNAAITQSSRLESDAEPSVSPTLPQNVAVPQLPAISPVPSPAPSPIPAPAPAAGASTHRSKASARTGASNPGQDTSLEWEELPLPTFEAPPEVQKDGNGIEAFENDMQDNFALNLELPDLDGNPQADGIRAPAPGGTAQQQTGAAPSTFVPNHSGLMDFDFNDLSLDLDVPGDAPGSTAAGTATASAVNAVTTADADLAGGNSTDTEDSLATKLSLAQEFHAIGDSEGARTLVEEVIAESSGTLKARARQLLADMD